MVDKLWKSFGSIHVSHDFKLIFMNLMVWINLNDHVAISLIVMSIVNFAESALTNFFLNPESIISDNLWPGHRIRLVWWLLFLFGMSHGVIRRSLISKAKSIGWVIKSIVTHHIIIRKSLNLFFRNIILHVFLMHPFPKPERFPGSQAVALGGILALMTCQVIVMHSRFLDWQVVETLRNLIKALRLHSLSLIVVDGALPAQSRSVLSRKVGHHRTGLLSPHWTNSVGLRLMRWSFYWRTWATDLIRVTLLVFFDLIHLH